MKKWETFSKQSNIFQVSFKKSMALLRDSLFLGQKNLKLNFLLNKSLARKTKCVTFILIEYLSYLRNKFTWQWWIVKNYLPISCLWQNVCRTTNIIDNLYRFWTVEWKCFQCKIFSDMTILMTSILSFVYYSFFWNRYICT